MQEVNVDNFSKEVNGHENYILDFSAKWCIPCKEVEKKLLKLKSEVNGKLKIGKVDIDKSPSIGAQFNVRSLPTIIFFKNGNPHEQITGNISYKKLKDLLEI